MRMSEPPPGARHVQIGQHREDIHFLIEAIREERAQHE